MILFVDSRQLDMAVQWMHAAALHCRDAGGLLVQPALSEPHRVRSQVLAALTALMAGPVVEEGTVALPPMAMFPGADQPPNKEQSS